MKPRQLRLVLGFLAVFVLLSAAPAMPDLTASFQGLFATSELPDRLASVELSDQLGDLLLLAAGGLVAAAGIIAVRRRWLARAQPVRRPAQRRSEPSRAVAVRPAAKSVAVARESALRSRIRKESESGIRIPDLARKFGISQDAVRGALGRNVIAPAARSGSSFRVRQPASQNRPRAAAVPARRRPYQVTA